jgi:ribulose-phosphate 3-epimerase
MIEDPDAMAPKYAENGCDSVTFHFEAAINVKQTISDIKSNGSKVGLAIKPGTKFSQVEEFISELDLLLIMTVEPGFGGQSFMTDQMEKVSQARAFINEGKAFSLLQVDGGISESTIEIAASAGANCFVAGSAVYKSSDPAETIVKLRNLASNSFRG